VPKYYFHDPQEWDDYDCDYYSLPPPKITLVTPLKIHIPSKDAVTWFVERTSKFFTTHVTSHVVLFDCCHSVSPFLVASYLVLVMKAPVKTAIESAGFTSSSKDSTTSTLMYDRRLIQELQTRFQGENEIPVPLPPPWFPNFENNDVRPVPPYRKPANGFALPAPRVPKTLKRTADAAAAIESREEGKKIRGTIGGTRMVIVKGGRTETR